MTICLLYDYTLYLLGMDISVIDLINIETFATKVISLTDYRQGLADYLRSKMSNVAPSLSALIGEQVGSIIECRWGNFEQYF